MFALFLALMLGAADTPPAAQPRPVSPVTVQAPGKPPPADIKLNMQGSDADIEQMVTIWPGTAYAARLDGRVTLRCLIDVHGLAERCEVASEVPAGKGFGKAAQEMRPTLKVAPAMGPDGPINATKTIALTFKAPDTQIDLKELASAPSCKLCPTDLAYMMRDSRNAMEMRKVTMLDFPVWAEAASFDDLAAAYPAKAGGVEGYAVDHCMVRAGGALANCQIIKEEPFGRDFGRAALSLAAKFKVIPGLAVPRHSAQLWVDIPIRFPPPAELAQRTVMAPMWVSAFDPKAAPKLFPPEAVAAGLTTGRGVARCVVGRDGALTNCTPEAGDPDGQGFSEAAAKLAGAMKMNLWSADASPVEGGVVHIPIRLNLKGG